MPGLGQQRLNQHGLVDGRCSSMSTVSVTAAVHCHCGCGQTVPSDDSDQLEPDRTHTKAPGAGTDRAGPSVLPLVHGICARASFVCLLLSERTMVCKTVPVEALDKRCARLGRKQPSRRRAHRTVFGNKEMEKRPRPGLKRKREKRTTVASRTMGIIVNIASSPGPRAAHALHVPVADTRDKTNMTPRPAEKRRLLVRKTRGLESGSLATNKLATHVVCVLRTASPELALQPTYQLLRSTPVTSLSRVRIPGLPHWVPQRSPVSNKVGDDICFINKNYLVLAQ